MRDKSKSYCYHNTIGILRILLCLLVIVSTDRIALAADIPMGTVEPNVTAAPDEDNSGMDGMPDDENLLSVSPSPSAADMSRLTRPRQLRVVNYTTSTVSLQWKKVKNARKYAIYRKKASAKTYRKIAVTRQCKYKNTKLKGKTVYRYKIMAIGENEEGEKITSAFSFVKKVRTKPVVRKTAYVGDSVMYGARDIYHHKGQKVIAKIGVSPWNFRNGDLMDRLLRYNPDRIYIMLGVNSLVGKQSSQQCNMIVADYKKIIRQCKKKNPDVDIIILSVAPSSATCKSVQNSYIDMYNKRQKKMARQMKVQYYDFTEIFKDSSGYLKKQYDGGDGLHWNVSGCICFAKQLKKYERKMA